jgi:hypothetical protein
MKPLGIEDFFSDLTGILFAVSVMTNPPNKRRLDEDGACPARDRQRRGLSIYRSACFACGRDTCAGKIRTLYFDGRHFRNGEGSECCRRILPIDNKASISRRLFAL